MDKNNHNPQADDIFYLGIPYWEANEALNLPEEHRLSGLREVFEILLERKQINTWLLGIKEGRQSPSRLASGEFPKIVDAYRREKARIANLVKDLDIKQEDINSLEQNVKDTCKDRNDLLKHCIINKLRKKSLIPFDLATMGKEALINKIIDMGGLEKFVQHYGLKISEEQKEEAIKYAGALNEEIKNAKNPRVMRRRSIHTKRVKRWERGKQESRTQKSLSARSK